MSDYDNVPELDENPVWITRQEAARLLRVSPSTVDLWAREGRITRKQLKVPGHTQFRPRFSYAEINGLVGDWEPGEFGHGGISPDRMPKPKKKG